MKNFKYICFVLLVILGCTDNDDKAIPSRSFSFIAADDGDEITRSAYIDEDNRTIHFAFDERVDVSEVMVSFGLNEGYVLIYPEQNPIQLNLEQSIEVKVQAPDGVRNYTLTAKGYETPFKRVEAIFRGKQIKGQIDPKNKCVVFPVSLFSSEYENISLSGIPVTITLNEGYSSDSALESSIKMNLSRNGLYTKLRLYKEGSDQIYSFISDVSKESVINYISDFKYKRGVNLSYWIVYSSDDWFDYFKISDAQQMQRYGFDHFRIPLEEKALFRSDGSLNRKACDKLHEMLTWCEQNEIRAILDMHILCGRTWGAEYREQDLYEDPAFRAHFIELWKSISKEFRNHSKKIVAYELLNEPHDYTEDASEWNKLQEEVMGAIRAEEPERIIFIPSMQWQDYTMVRYAKVLKGDPNVVISFHYYLPMFLTHYRFAANLKGYEGSVYYPGKVMSDDDARLYPEFKYWNTVIYNKERIRKEIGQAVDAAKSAGLNLHCGEFGCIRFVNRESRLAWINDIVSVFNEYDLPYTQWECLGGGFGFQEDDGTIDYEMLEILTGYKP